MQPLDDEARPAVEPEKAATDGLAAPAAAVAKRPLAAFDRVPVKWLAVTGGVMLLLIIAAGAVILLNSPSGRSTSAAPVQAVPGPGAASPGPGGSTPGAQPPGSSGSTNATGPGPGAGAGPGSQPGSTGVPPASVDALKALLIDAPGTDSTVDIEPIDDTTFAGARWGVTLFWASPEGSMVLAQYSTPDEARAALGLYRGSVHDSGICDEQAVGGRTDAYLCAAKGLGDAVNQGDVPAIGLGMKGTVVALVTATDLNNVQQLLAKQLDRLP